jgi:hypothetical protein
MQANALLGDGTRGQDCRVVRSILCELTSKRDAFPTIILAKFQLAGFNDNYLRTMTSAAFKEATDCSSEFADAVELKIMHKIRRESWNQTAEDTFMLPPKATTATPAEIARAVEHFLHQNGAMTQKAVADMFFHDCNVQIPLSTLCRRLNSARMNFATVEGAGRPQLLEDWICTDLITPALVQFRAIGRTKWKQLLRMLMKQLARAQRGIGPVQGIMELVHRRQRDSGTHASQIILDDDDELGRGDGEDNADDSEKQDEELLADSQQMLESNENIYTGPSFFAPSFQADDIMNPSAEQCALQDMRKRLRQHSKLQLTKVDHNEFPSVRTFQRYCKKFGWSQRKIELMAPHRQNGVSPSRIAANYAELSDQYSRHDIVHPNQIIVCDELHWCKEWGDILEFIQGVCESGCKRSQGDGPARLKDGVTVCPFGSIIGYLYLLQVIVKKSQKLNVRAIKEMLVKYGFAADAILVSETDSGYQTADSFREAVEVLVFRLHSAEGGSLGLDFGIESIRLRRKYLLIADGSSTHPFGDIGFCLLIALAGLFFHQQEPDSTHVCNLHDRFVFLQTKLYSAKEVLMHLAMKFAPRVSNDNQATAWIEEITSSLAKTVDISSDVCPNDLLITDESVLVKFETILKCRDASFDTMHLMECIFPALAKGLSVNVVIASAKAVGLLPRDFHIVPGYDYAANVHVWRGPFVETVLKQSCVQGQADRELRMERWNANKTVVVREHMADFGFDIFRAGLESEGPSIINSNVLEATLSTCFDVNSLAPDSREQLSLLFSVYEQQKKVEAKRLKDLKSRNAVSEVNGRNEADLIQANAQMEATDAASAAEKLNGLIDHASKKADEAIKQFELLASRSKKCEDLLLKLSSALQSNSETGALIKTCKRTVDWAQNNAANGDELWQTARADKTKIQRLNTTNEAIQAVQAFVETFNAQEERFYSHNVDILILPVVDLGFAVREACAPQDDWALQFVREL